MIYRAPDIYFKISLLKWPAALTGDVTPRGVSRCWLPIGLWHFTPSLPVGEDKAKLPSSTELRSSLCESIKTMPYSNLPHTHTCRNLNVNIHPFPCTCQRPRSPHAPSFSLSLSLPRKSCNADSAISHMLASFHLIRANSGGIPSA